ncbi:MAG: protease modulator HflC [Gammaproteobacteria bacterium]|jgi:membrane protease subunit HflC|nr:protease modulator HflC [Gammaproteobacteria bacterium]
MKIKSIILGFLGLGLIALYLACSIIEPYQQGVVFKKTGPEILKPGFYITAPWPAPIQKIDMRAHNSTISAIAATTQDKMNVLVDVSVFWSIQNSVIYVNNTHANSGQIDSWLKQNISATIQQGVSKKTLAQLLGQPSNSLTQGLNTSLSQSAAKTGIQIIDINVQGLHYAPDMLNKVYQNMQDSAQASANQVTAQAKQEVDQIKEQGQLAVNSVINNAQVQAASIRGQGEAQAQEIYNKAYQKDPQFYAFYRSMQLYQQLLTSKNTVLVVKPQGQFLKYLNSYKP